MNNLKRALSLALSGIMLVGMMAVGVSAADYKDFTDKDEITHTEAVSTMSLLGVILGKDTGAFDPKGTVTRAEMAKMITVALNGGKNPVLGTKTNPTYSDIKGHWAEQYIEYCDSLHIIAGQGDGTFAPDNTVTGAQAAKMMLVAMGYEAEVYKMVGADWEINTTREANDAGLFEELDSMNPSEGMSRDDAAQLIWNGVQAKTLTKSPSQSVTTGEITFRYDLNGPSILENKFKVYTAIGQLSDVDEGALTITDDKAWDNDETFAGNTNPNQSSFTKVGTDYSAYLGQTVKVLYKANDNVVGVAPMGINKVYDVAQSKITVSDTVKVKFDGATYSLADKTVTTAPATVTDNQVKTLTVGVASKDVSVGVANASQLKSVLSYNNIRFIDNDNDGKIEYAVITEVVPAKVSYVSSSEIIAEGVTYKKANDTVADGIEKNDYVTVTYNPFTAKREVVKAEKLTDVEVTGYRVNSDGNYEYRVDDTWYVYDKDSATTGVSAGEKADMVAVNGVIFFIEETEGNSSLDDVVIVIDKDNTSTVISRQAVILKADGTKQTVTMDVSSSGAVDPTVGELYTYSITDNGYKFKAVAADIGDYTFVAGDKAVTGTTTIDKVDGKNIADSAVIFLFADKKGEVITGKQLKAQLTSFAKSGSPVEGYFTGKVDGLTRVVMASIQVANASNLDNIAAKASSYAVIVDSAYQSSSDYITYKVWDGSDVITVREKDTSSATLSARTQKAVIAYSAIDGDVIKDVTDLLTGGAAKASIQGKSGTSKVWLNGQLDGTHDYKITSDTVVLYVDFSASTADEIGLSGGEIRLADKVDNYYTQNVIAFDAQPMDKELELLVVDVKNNIGTKYAVGKLGTYTTVTSARKDGATGNVKAGTTVEFTLTNTAASAVTVKATYGTQEAVITVPGNGTATASFLQPAATVDLTLAANP